MSITPYNKPPVVLPSPYTPGAGIQPRALIARSVLVDRLRADLLRVHMTATASPRVTMFVGARGLGKTVLLGQARQVAEELGFRTVHLGLDRTGHAVQRLAHVVGQALAELKPVKSQFKRLVEVLRLFSLELSAAGVVKVSSQWQPETPAAEVARDELRDLLVSTATAARANGGAGLLVTLDELQEAPGDQLAVLAHTIQDVTSSTAPLAVIGAGLPHLPETLMKVATFTERFHYSPLERFTPDEALLALAQPARESGVEWSQEAAERVLEHAGGAPFLIQLYGDETWLAARPTGPGQLQLWHAEQGVSAGQATLNSGLFRGRWERASDLEQALLVAIAELLEDDGTAAMGKVVERLGVTHQKLSAPRRRLIDKGIIESPRYGRVAYTMPGFERYVLAQGTQPLQRAIGPSKRRPG